MKTKSLFYFLLAIPFFSDCSKDSDNVSVKKTGYLSLSVKIDMTINTVSPGLKSTMAAEDFIVKIYNISDQEVLSFDRADAIPPQVELEVGDYYVVSYSDNLQPAAFDSPYYYGRSQNFTLESAETETVTITCTLANCAVSVAYTENVRSNFNSYNTEITTNGGGILLYNETETRKGYFELNAITIRSTLTYSLTDGTIKTKVLNGSIASPQAGKHYEVVINSVINEGRSVINIVLDETEISEQITISDEDTISGLAPGSLLITEIMYDPDSIDQPDGEWFELYNNSATSLNLKGLIIRRASNNHEISEDIILDPGEYYALARSEDAFQGIKYIYSAITLTNSETTLSIFNFGTDGTDGSEIISITYGGSGFPKGNGASVNLDPARFNYNDTRLASSWCQASAQYNTGDLGTPGLPNSNCE